MLIIEDYRSNKQRVCKGYKNFQPKYRNNKALMTEKLITISEEILMNNTNIILKMKKKSFKMQMRSILNLWKRLQLYKSLKIV